MGPNSSLRGTGSSALGCREFDFGTVSEEDEPETEGEEDLQFLFQEELESSEDDAFSWEGVDPSEEEIDSPSDDDEPMGGKPFQFLGSSEEDR